MSRSAGLVASLVLTGLVCVAAVDSRSASPAQLAPNGKVQICHATSSQSNPYVSEEPTLGNNGDLNGGHLNHTGPVYPSANWGDIIPPYTYVDQSGVEQVFPGYNWSPQGQAIWESGCTPGTSPLTPFVQCVEADAGGGLLAHFGYDNPNATAVQQPFENAFTPAPADRGQPTVFQPGHVKDAVQVHLPDDGSLTWSLTGNKATATSASTHCVGSITVVKILNPSDRGRFDLEIDGAVAGGAAAVGDGGTTGTIAVDSGRHTVSESGVAPTDLTKYFTQIVCRSDAAVVAEGSSASLSVPVLRDQAVRCSITNTLRNAPKPLVPSLECVVFRNGAPETAVWSYTNDNAFAVPAPVGAANGFVPAPADRGQPTTFQSGTWTGNFETPFAGASTLTWTLTGRTATASSASPPCTAIIELRKVTAPAGDPGVFNLLLNGQVLATGGNGTIAGPYTVGVGEGTVSETAAPGTNLSDYSSTIACLRNGTPEVSIPGTKVDGSVGNGDFVVCTFTNTRITVPSTPIPPEPPVPPKPDTQPPTAPEVTPPLPEPPSQVDLAVTKDADPTTVVVGQTITWTVRVTNASPVAANDVNVVKVFEHSYRADVVSVTSSQGTCTATGCDLGRIAPGGSATITVVTRTIRTGVIANVVRVGSEEQEADYRNNTAAAVARVIGPLRAQTPVCRTLTAAPRLLRTGTASVVLTTARNRFGVRVSGVTVHMRGHGIDRRATTDSRGVARFTVMPSQPGLVVFRGATRAPAAARTGCGTVLAALYTKPGSVTG